MTQIDPSQISAPGTNSHPSNKVVSSEASTEVDADSANPSTSPPTKPGHSAASSPLDEQELPDQAEGEDNHPVPYLKGFEIFVDQFGKACISTDARRNRRTYRVGSKDANKLIRRNARKEGTKVKRLDLAEINEALLDHAETDGKRYKVFYRIAPTEDGIEIDLGTEDHARVRISPGNVQIVFEESKTYFNRTVEMLPIRVSENAGNCKLLKKYLINISATDRLLLLAWVSYVLAHPKISSTAFPILVLLGGQGTGKTTLSKLLLRLVDPRIVGVQIMPANANDLVIAAQRAHVLSYDNLRGFRRSVSDLLCVAATSGAISLRKLYTDDEPHILFLHVALILNGVHDFIGEPDLAQRSLPIKLEVINESARVSESKLEADLCNDLPIIIRGFHELIGEVFKHLPDVEVTRPQRMIDFSRWLAAMEKVDGAPPETYQDLYAECLVEAQLESLLANPLAAALIDFVEGRSKTWQGKPTELLAELNGFTPFAMQRSPDWPKNSIALGRRISSLQAGLKTQGIEITQTRSKHRKITVTTTEILNEE